MDAYFVSPQRTEDAELAFEIETVSKIPVVSALLISISGLLAILDEHRQRRRYHCLPGDRHIKGNHWKREKGADRQIRGNQEMWA